jgi:hypothetical protein
LTLNRLCRLLRLLLLLLIISCTLFCFCCFTNFTNKCLQLFSDIAIRCHCCCNSFWFSRISFSISKSCNSIYKFFCFFSNR